MQKTLVKKVILFVLTLSIFILMLASVNASNRKSNSFIFANSSKVELSEENLCNLDYRVLFLARNEIYARRGYMFKSENVKNYFANKSWYKPGKISSAKLSEIEKNNAEMIKDYEDYRIDFEKGDNYDDDRYRSNQAVFDLNGDGKMEQIEYNIKDRDNCEYELKVNGVTVKGKGEELSDYFGIVDIDESDDFKEIAIEEYGPSDDFKTTFYYYNGKKLVKMGEIYDLCGSFRNIGGKGRIKAVQRYDILQTWFYNAEFQLMPDRKLKFVEKGLYSSSDVQELEVIKSFSIYRTRGSKEVVKSTRAGEKVKILGSDLKKWCYIEASGGVKGWFEVRDFNIVKELGVPADEVFDGLCNAD